jgi:hypothetical protein
MLDLIRSAIRDRRQIAFWSTGYHRIACPHLLGTKLGAWHLFVWQINDESEHGFEPGAQRWRCIEIGDITGLEIHPGEWVRGWSGGQRGQSCVDVIDTQVDPVHAAEVRSTFPARTQSRALARTAPRRR